MAQTAASISADRKRVKVYELKNNDWYDRGTGFCTGQIVQTPGSSAENPDGRILVVSEEDVGRTLLETRITKDDGYQKQQETLIVWTESDGIDMALSFQEAEGCAGIWEFVSDVQGRLAALAPDDNLSDDLLDPTSNVVLPDPQLGRLDELEEAIKLACSSSPGRDALIKFIMHPDHLYILKLCPLVEMAEEARSLPDLHKLCAIMKHFILLNDTAIIEFIVTDAAIAGVVGALEYDPDFPAHKANHRQYLGDPTKYKEVVPITDEEIRRKIDWTYRLLYMKDVVLARILDDPTFGVLNSLIFYHQVDIVNHLQMNIPFLKELFDIFHADEKAAKRYDAVLFIQNCCAISKNIQPANRMQLYTNFIHYGLFTVITFALTHHDAAVRVAGTDILVAMIDHDHNMVRNHVFTAIKEKGTPLTDTLISLLLVEVDLGVKAQMADALKVLLDPTPTQAGIEMMNRNAMPEGNPMKQHRLGPGGIPIQNPQSLSFIDAYYETSAKRLFAPLKALESRPSLDDLTIHEVSLFTHLIEVLCFFVRQHSHRSKSFIHSENLHRRIAQLFGVPQKFAYLKVVALRWFRTCVALQDEWHNRVIIEHELFDPILREIEIVMPRDNLISSSCIEIFEFIKREGFRQLIVHLVDTYYQRFLALTDVTTFHALIQKYEQMNEAYAEGDGSFTTHEGTPQRIAPAGAEQRQPFAGLKEMDGDEEAYFNGADDEDDGDDEPGLPTSAPPFPVASPLRPLVSYPDDEDEVMDTLASSPDVGGKTSRPSSDGVGMLSTSDESLHDSATSPPTDDAMDEDDTRGRSRQPVPLQGSPGQGPQSPSEGLTPRKRGREDEDEDELGKMMGAWTKRRTSTSSAKSGGAVQDAGTTASVDSQGNGIVHQPVQKHTPAAHPPPLLRRKGSMKTKNESTHFAPKALQIKKALASSGNTDSQPRPQHPPSPDLTPEEGKEDAEDRDWRKVENNWEALSPVVRKSVEVEQQQQLLEEREREEAGRGREGEFPISQ